VAGAAVRRALIATIVVVGGAVLWLALAQPSAVDRSRRPASGSGEPGIADRAQQLDTGSGARAAAAGATGTRPPSEPHAQSSDQVRARLARQARELRALNDTRYRDYAARWPNEIRDDPWSSDQERSLRASAAAAGIDHLLFALECRATLCRIELSAADSDTAFALQRARGWSALLGQEVGSAPIGSGADRALEILTARNGMGAPKGP
jgi:hypothetical protein